MSLVTQKDFACDDGAPGWLRLPEAAFYCGLSINVLSLLVNGGQLRYRRLTGQRGIPVLIDRASIDELLERTKQGERIAYRRVKTKSRRVR
jgi:hypothetical protein